MPREVTSLNNLFFDKSLIRKNKNVSPSRDLTLNKINSSKQNTTGSFRFDAPGSAIKSTQQLNLDFSNFENHTFFNSAQTKVQKSFGKIINNFPFDGTKDEIDNFLDSLSGFEKYVFDNFPSRKGYLVFNNGSFLRTDDFQGSFSPELSKKSSGKSVVDFGTGPFTAEFYINIPSGSSNQNQIIFQKTTRETGGQTQGLTIALNNSTASSDPLAVTDIVAILSSGSQYIKANMEIQKGSFHHVSVVLDKTGGPSVLKMYRDAVQISNSNFGEFGQLPLGFVTSSITFGTGTAHYYGGTKFDPSITLNGAIDEFRFWHKAKTQEEIYSQKFGNVFAQQYLQLYYRFNEPSGSFSSNGAGLVLDHSGNGLHTSVNNFSMSLKNSSSFGEVPLTSEDPKNSPVLFPSFLDVQSFNEDLLTSASFYDYNNPNLVTKLIPPHYILAAQEAEGFETEDGDISDLISGQDKPGGAKIGQAQIISLLLYTMAETFDELKCFVDEFKRLLKVDYVTKDTISDQLLPWLSKYYGIRIPHFFSNASIEQLNDGQNINLDRSPTASLQTIQNILWRRVFSDLPKILSTRGTMESLKSVLRNFGINSDGPIRIRELGGSSNFSLGNSYLKRHEIASMLDFSGSLGGFNPTIVSKFLSGSRVEPGYPPIKGFVLFPNIASSDDGLYTSGSWTFEGTYKFKETVDHPSTQSLIRVFTTGSLSTDGKGILTFNLLATAPDELTSTTGSIQLWGRPNAYSSSDYFSLVLTGVNIFDGEKWQISFGRNRNDEIGSYSLSSYFLRSSKFTAGGLENYFATSSYFNDNQYPVLNTLQTINSTVNSSGSFLVIGSQSLGTAYTFCLNSSVINSISRTTDFTGKVSGLRFWSKGLSELETKMHARNFKSLGVENPEVNFNFVTHASGSFQKLRFDVNIDQPITKSDSSGNILLKDFSQNNFSISGSGFESNKSVILPERFDFEILSPDFKSENPNKIRIRSFLDENLASLNDAQIAPLNKLPQNEQPKDDKRVQIEISAVQALNEDIMNIFATLDYMDNAIGSPELVFSQEYPSLKNLRRIYFNRLTDKVNFSKVFDFFKWFDDSIGDYLEQMLPYDSKLIGVSFVIEPHALERSKFIYNYYDMYLGDETKDKNTDGYANYSGDFKKI